PTTSHSSLPPSLASFPEPSFFFSQDDILIYHVHADAPDAGPHWYKYPEYENFNDWQHCRNEEEGGWGEPAYWVPADMAARGMSLSPLDSVTCLLTAS